MTISTNTYSVQFACADPETRFQVVYTFTVKTKPQDVVRAVDMLRETQRAAMKPAYIEDLADRLRTRFPGEHTLKANVLGVDAVTTRQGAGT